MYMYETYMHSLASQYLLHIRDYISHARIYTNRRMHDLHTYAYIRAHLAISVTTSIACGLVAVLPMALTAFSLIFALIVRERQYCLLLKVAESKV